MADDIFDQVAAQPKQDIFDQAAILSPAYTPRYSEAEQVAQAPDVMSQARAAAVPVGMQQTERVMQQTMGGPPQFVDVPKGQGQKFQQAGQQGYQTGGEIGTGMVAGAATGALPELANIELPLLARLGLGGAVGATGYGAGRLAAGQKPTMRGTSQAAAIGGASELGGEALSGAAGGAWKQVKRLFGETPERLEQLGQMFPTKESLEQAVTQAEAKSRAAFHAAYDAMGIDAEPVNVSASKNLAKQAIQELQPVHDAPAPLSKVASIPDPSENVLTGDNVAGWLKQLAGFDNIEFRQAQRLRSNLENWIGTGPRKPVEIYQAIKKVTGALTDSLEQTADRAGVLPQFQQAESMVKQHAADFWGTQSRTGPLKRFLNVPPGTKPSQLAGFLNKINDSRALDALQRYGISTDAAKSILARGSKQIGRDVKDAAMLRNLGPDTLNQFVGARNRAAAAKLALGLGGGTALGRLAYYLSSHGKTH